MATPIKKQLLSIFVSVVFSGILFSQEPLKLSTEELLQDKAHCDRIESFFLSGIRGNFPGAENISIEYRTFLQAENEKGAIMISTGRTEGMVKYMELIYDLYQQGYSIYIHDHRGQGFSGRMADDPQMGHVDDFINYVHDMKKFYDEYVSSGKHEKHYLLAHSMGGTIALYYLELYPEDFQAAVLSSPMLGLSAYICPLAKVLSGKQIKYAPGQQGYTDDSTAFSSNSVSYSETRYFHKLGIYEKYPRCKLGGSSIQWVEEACRGMKFVNKNSEKLQTPFILFTAGDESVVDADAHHTFIKKLEGKGLSYEHQYIPDAKHELFMEKDKVRNKVLFESLSFFSRY